MNEIFQQRGEFGAQLVSKIEGSYVSRNAPSSVVFRFDGAFFRDLRIDGCRWIVEDHLASDTQL